MCPDCRGSLSGAGAAALQCDACGRDFPILQGNILSLMPNHPRPLPDAYNDPDYRRMSAHFDDSSPYFTDGNIIFRSIHQSSHKKIHDWMSAAPDGDWICDLGCGQGYHYRYVKNPERVIGIDIRVDSLRRVREMSPVTPLIQADSCALPFKSGTVSAGISIYVLEHIYHLDDTIKEFARILKPNAKLYVGLPCEGGLAWTLGRKITSERTMSQRYNVDYRKYIALEHCNTASKVMARLENCFYLEQRSYFPLSALATVHANLTVTLALQKR